MEHFGWYQSRLRTANNELVVLPNSMLAKEQVVNLSRRTSKKIQATFRVRYDDLPKVHPLLEELSAAAAEGRENMPGKIPQVCARA